VKVGLPINVSDPRVTRRDGVRAVLLDADERVLLLKTLEPSSRAPVWITPGGALEPGESSAVGLRREILEETGLTDFDPGPVIWVREHLFRWGKQTIYQREKIFLVRVEHFDPNTAGMDDAERCTLAEWRSWDVDSIMRSHEIFVPSRLASLLRELIRIGPGDAAIDAGT